MKTALAVALCLVGILSAFFLMFPSLSPLSPPVPSRVDGSVLLPALRGTAGQQKPPHPAAQFPRRGEVTVNLAVDGDTFETSTGMRVRLIGINAPDRGEPFYREAAAYLKREIQGKKVSVETDVEEYDGYDRLLAYVYLDDRMINEEIVRAGLARAQDHPPNVRYSDRLRQAQAEASREGLFIWRDRSVHDGR